MKEIVPYDHVVRISSAGVLTVCRLIDDREDLVWQLGLPKKDRPSQEFNNFCQELGELILIDSPQARKFLDL